MPRAIDVFVGNRIRDHRIQLGLTQEELGRRIGLDQEKIDTCESGQERLEPYRLVMLAAVLDCSIGELFGHPVKPFPGLGFSNPQPKGSSDRASPLSWSVRRAGRHAPHIKAEDVPEAATAT